MIERMGEDYALATRYLDDLEFQEITPEVGVDREIFEATGQEINELHA